MEFEQEKPKRANGSEPNLAHFNSFAGEVAPDQDSENRQEEEVGESHAKEEFIKSFANSDTWKPVLAGGLTIAAAMFLGSKLRTKKTKSEQIRQAVSDSIDTMRNETLKMGETFSAEDIKEALDTGKVALKRRLENSPKAVTIGIFSALTAAAAIAWTRSENRFQKAGRRGGLAKPYSQRSRQELYQRAQELGIKGRSTMSKEELLEAIQEY